MSYFLETHLKENLYIFEDFLSNIGFKRIEGSVFGLLALSNHPLSAEEIEKNLELSQSSVSNALKTLAHYGAIETRDSREKRVKLHCVKEDALSIAATVFKKREQEAIESFKNQIEDLITKIDEKDSIRISRLKSIVATSLIAEAVMNFVIKLSKNHTTPYYDDIVKVLPRALDFLTNASDKIPTDISHLKNHLSQGLKNKFIQLTGQKNV